MLIYLVLVIIILISLNTHEQFKSIKSKYTAIIIEPRQHKALEFVLKNFSDNLSNEWNIIIFHGNLNIDYVKNIILKIKRPIKMINLNVDNLTIQEYNKMFYTKTFYDNIPTETFLVFQTDTMICKTFKKLINNFLKYDYVGAPWKGINGLYGVGNGGLSLRKKSKMLEMINKCNSRIYEREGILHNEDIFFSNLCADKVNMNKPDLDESKNFSIETVYNDETFGIHKCWNYMTPDNLKKINDFCPELDKLVELNH